MSELPWARKTLARSRGPRLPLFAMLGYRAVASRAPALHVHGHTAEQQLNRNALQPDPYTCEQETEMQSSRALAEFVLTGDIM